MYQDGNLTSALMPSSLANTLPDSQDESLTEHFKTGILKQQGSHAKFSHIHVKRIHDVYIGETHGADTLHRCLKN